MPKILVIIPAYNEEEAILRTVADLERACPQTDYLVVNDCSTDGTEALLTSHNIRHVRLPVNLGIGGSVQTGFQYALAHGYDIAVQMDGDGQHRAEYIPALVAPVAAGEADLALGSRFLKGKGFQSTGARRAGIAMMRAIIRCCTGQKVLDATSGFRAFNQALITRFAQDYAQDYPEPEVLATVLAAGYRVAEVPVEMAPRQGGSSSISPWGGVYYMCKVSLAVLLAGIRLSTRKERVRA